MATDTMAKMDTVHTTIKQLEAKHLEKERTHNVLNDKLLLKKGEIAREEMAVKALADELVKINSEITNKRSEFTTLQGQLKRETEAAEKDRRAKEAAAARMSATKK